VNARAGGSSQPSEPVGEPVASPAE